MTILFIDSCVENVLRVRRGGQLGYYYYNPVEDGTLHYGGSSEEENYVGRFQIYFGGNSVKTCS